MAFTDPNTGLRRLDNVSGFGGFNFTPYAPGEISYGYSNAAAQGFSDTARTILQGSEKSQEELQRGYESLFLARALGDRAGFQENERRLGFEGPAAGLSPSLVRLGGFQRESDLISRMGGYQAEASGGFHKDLAELYKGTATELAGLGMSQSEWIQQALLSKKQRKADTQAGYMQLAGQAAGVAAAGFGKGGAWA